MKRFFALLLPILLANPLLSQKLTVADYSKQEVYITMRDGTRLFTSIYSPKNTGQKYPVMLMRTPYSVKPYGEDNMRESLGPNQFMMADGYIFVYQDVRGRWMSEGLYDNMRPQINNQNKKKQKEIDESTDTYDTIDWLVKNLKNNNGKVGQWGISYPGFYTAVGIASDHPALVASSPQAPISDFFFDDFHHHGAYLLSYWAVTPLFGIQKTQPVDTAWYQWAKFDVQDGYEFYKNLGPLKNTSKYYGEDNFFWQQLASHPNYDEFWQSRNLLPHLKNVDHAVMTVGGLFDAEDLYGPFNIYKTIESNSPKANNTIVMGPWSHGDWARNRGSQYVSYIKFGDSISYNYQREIEEPFFRKYLKGASLPAPPEAYIFDTGSKQWHSFNAWPPAEAKPATLYLGADEALGFEQDVQNGSDFSDFVSDHNKPVPFTEDEKIVFTPRKYMADDQRFNSNRPDVLVFETPVLTENITLTGEMLATLFVATDKTDADWVVKLIDVYPADTPDDPNNPKEVKLGGYQQLVRSEMFRGRFRESYSQPKPFVPNQVTKVEFPLQGVLHTFKAGHKIMVHVQSSWFPLIDRNPQNYVDNIFEADEKDFVRAWHKVYHNPEHSSKIEVKILP